MYLPELRALGKRRGIPQAYKKTKGELIQLLFGTEEEMRIYAEAERQRIVNEQEEYERQLREANERRARIEEENQDLIKYIREMINEEIDSRDLCTGECRRCRWESGSYNY